MYYICSHFFFCSNFQPNIFFLPKQVCLKCIFSVFVYLRKISLSYISSLCLKEILLVTKLSLGDFFFLQHFTDAIPFSSSFHNSLWKACWNPHFCSSYVMFHFLRLALRFSLPLLSQQFKYNLHRCVCLSVRFIYLVCFSEGFLDISFCFCHSFKKIHCHYFFK